MLVLIVILIIVFGFGGGYYGGSLMGPNYGFGGGIGLVLLCLLLFWLFGGALRR